MADNNATGDIMLDIQNLKTYFYTSRGVAKAVDDVSLTLHKGEFLGLVGESGCGKTVTALSALKLVPFPGKVVEGRVGEMVDGRQDDSLVHGLNAQGGLDGGRGAKRVADLGFIGGNGYRG